MFLGAAGSGHGLGLNIGMGHGHGGNRRQRILGWWHYARKRDLGADMFGEEHALAGSWKLDRFD